VSTGLAASPILERIRRLCDELEDPAGPGPAGIVAGVRASLDEPLRVAVVGRVKAGKSTLVNALVGRAVAPTAAGECTRIVTWYRYGSPDRAELELRSGERRVLPFTGSLPEDVGVPAGDVARLTVHLQSRRLRDLTLIDTPGLAALTEENVAATRAALLGQDASRRSTGQADAVLFVFREAERSDELDFLREFRDSSGELGASAVNAVGVLSQADLFGSGPWSGEDPLALARSRAAALAAARAAEVTTVVPVSGLFAETARTGRVREQDARVLAATVDADPTMLQLWETVGPPEGVTVDQMRRLFGLLGPYGVAAGRTAAVGGAASLQKWLDDLSGIAEVERQLHAHLVDRTAALKASHALEVLERAAPQAAREDEFRDLVETAQLDGVLHPLRELRALQMLLREQRDTELRQRLLVLTTGSDDRARAGLAPGVPASELARHARQAAATAQALVASAATPYDAEAARVVARSYQLIARRAEAAAS
jgi:hypothetical protein